MDQLIISIDSLDIANASERREQWLTALASSHSEILVDPSNLKNIDSSGLQLLLSFQKEALLGGKEFYIGNSSAILSEKAAAIGLSQLFRWKG